MVDAEKAMEGFIKSCLLLSEPFVAKFLFRILTQDSYVGFQKAFFNILTGNNRDLCTRDLGFEISQDVEHKDCGMVKLIMARRDEVVFIEPVFFNPDATENIARLVRILDTCYQDYPKKTIYILTRKNRVDCCRRNVQNEQGGRHFDAGTVKVDFIFWDDILACLRNTT